MTPGSREASRYPEVIAQCAQGLQNLERWLVKAEQHAAARKFDVSVLLHGRLAPDQKPLTFQVQSACDSVKSAAAWLSGQTPPGYPDTEQTVAELRARIHTTLAFVGSVGADRYAGAGERTLSFPWAPGKVMSGHDYLLQLVIPNTYFHLTMAYAILRHNGVELGKMDFLGAISLTAA